MISQKINDIRNKGAQLVFYSKLDALLLAILFGGFGFRFMRSIVFSPRWMFFVKAHRGGWRLFDRHRPCGCFELFGFIYWWSNSTNPQHLKVQLLHRLHCWRSRYKSKCRIVLHRWFQHQLWSRPTSVSLHKLSNLRQLNLQTGFRIDLLRHRTNLLQN